MKFLTDNPIIAVIASGIVYAILLPPFSASTLAWVALVPLLMVLASSSPWRAFGYGALWALCATVAVAWWFPAMLVRYFDLPGTTAWLGLIGLGGLVDGLPYAFFGLWVGWGARRGVLNPLTVSAAFALTEWVRANGPVANPFALLAYSQSGNPFAQISDLAGPYGVGMLIVAVNVAIAGLVIPALGGRHPLRRMGLTVAVVILAFGYGHWRLQQDFGHGESLQVALVQGAVARELEWDRSTRGANLERYLSLTREAGKRSPDLVFWPEFAVDFYLREATVQRARLLDGVRAVGADLVLGGSHYRFAKQDPDQDHEERTDYFNSVFVVDSMGRLRTDRYDKRRLVPFAEYGPFGDSLRAKTAVYVPGDEPRLLAVRGMQLGAFICGESLHPEIARELAMAGAELLANPSNDYWFGHPQAAAHQLQVASLRAIENRRYLVRPTSTGISAVVDPHGHTLVRSQGQGPEILHASLRRSSTVTPYHRVGEGPLVAAAAWIASVSLIGIRSGINQPGGKT
jgi:apolipoprotein N-acyltransferase